MNPEMKKIKKQIVPILKKHGVKKAGIFGSFARGEQTKRSDVDILVKLPKKTSLLDIIGIEQEIEDKTHRKADLVEYTTIHPLLKNQILKEEVPVL